MTPEAFKVALAAGVTAEDLRTTVDLFKATFAKLPEDQKRPLRALWKERQQQLGVEV